MDELDPANYQMKGPKIAPQSAVNGAVEVKPFIPGLDDNELRKMAREKLSELLQAMDSKSSPSLLLSVVRETMDRLDGRPTQKVETKTLVATIDLNEHKRQVRQQAVEMMERLSKVKSISSNAPPNAAD